VNDSIFLKPRLVVLVLALILSGCFSPLSERQEHRQPLAKIRISNDGRSFVTDTGKPFVPFGVNYYRPDTGWAPQIWKQFNAEATRRDFAKMKKLGVNCVRVFLTYHSFHFEPGKLNPEGLAKFDQFLEIAEQAGIYVHPAGPEFWEGKPNWKPVAIADERTLQYTEEFWKLFAARYRGRHVLFAYDLKNEPDVGWNNEIIARRWNAWLEKKYATAENIQLAWHDTNKVAIGLITVPKPRSARNDPQLLDFQHFREDIADEWTRRQVEAIKSADPEALTTVGCLQTSVPSRFWGGIDDYTGFVPLRQAKYLDFLEIHFYPSEGGGYEYRKEADELANLAYLEGIVREMARPGKPVVLAEFGWYGGKEKPKFDHGAHPLGTEKQQATFLRHVIETSSGFVTGWLNWGLYDQPGADDCSELTGLLTTSGRVKEWGRTFHELSSRYSGMVLKPPKTGPRPDLDWNACVTSGAAGKQFRQEYLKRFLADRN
jgi:aryl-phospho-beta-D-glucosidase BglC (GH1 family)